MPDNETTETTTLTDRVRYRVGPKPTYTAYGKSHRCIIMHSGDIVTKTGDYDDGNWRVARERDRATGHIHPRHLTPVDESPAPSASPAPTTRYRVGPAPTFTESGKPQPCNFLRKEDIVTKIREDNDGDWVVTRERDGAYGRVHPRHLTPADETPVDEAPAPAAAPSPVLLSDGTPRYMLIPNGNAAVVAVVNPGYLAWNVIDRASTLGPTVIASFRGYVDAHTYLTNLDK